MTGALVAAVVALASVMSQSAVRAQSAGGPELAPVLEPTSLAGQPVPSAAGISAALRKPLSGRAFGGPVQVSVLNPADGLELYGATSSVASTPASTAKLLTAMSVLSAYGPDARVATTVAQQAPGQLVLIGGGDPLLQVKPSRTANVASLDQLAKQTAADLRAASPGSVPSVRVRFDDSLFTGPTAAPGWEPSYTKASTALVPPITALLADEGFVNGDVDVVPGLEAAKAFVVRLKATGVRVRGDVSRTVADSASAPLTQVFSPPMSMIVGHTLEHSDNTAAEMLGHLAGGRLAGAYSFAGGVAATTQVLATLGIGSVGVTLNDASGLSRADRIPPIVLARVLAAATVNSSGSLWPLISGLPVAGFDGTLAKRFAAANTAGGRGYVRAKTGTLTGVTALAGTVVDVSGATVIFVFMVPTAADGSAAAAGLDRAAAALAACGCGSVAAGAAPPTSTSAATPASSAPRS